MTTLHDAEFGDITVVRRSLATRASLSLSPNGQLRITLPHHAPLMAARLALRWSRDDIRQLLRQRTSYQHDQPIGKRHHLRFQEGAGPTVTRSGHQLIVSLPASADRTTPTLQQLIRREIIAALRLEARHYLPKRLAWLAKQHGFSYRRSTLTHASSRWGSCSSRGTISLNIALMNVPLELIDYVLIHELCHTRQMNHSPAFWREVAALDPAYQQHRRQLKHYTPHV